jgi:flagellar protein FlgJ
MSPQEATLYLSFAWEQVTGEPASLELISVLWAQWALETGRGRWMVDYNYAGLKGRAPDGGLAHWWTWEETEKGPRRVRAKFRSYETAEEGARDYVELLWSRYPKAIAAAQRGDAISFVLELDDGGFFTERPKHYVGSVASLAAEFRRGHRAARF